MGGGEDSRIPAILSESLASSRPDIRVIVRTYSFDPDVAYDQIMSWVDELKPSLIVGESLGANHALAIKGMPHILVSPAMGTPAWFRRLAWLLLIPGAGALLDHIYKPRPGKRQAIHFEYSVMRRWKAHEAMAYEAAATEMRNGRTPFAFFGSRDHYLKWGIVNISSWRRHFGHDSCAIYDGTHFMEEEHVRALLVPKICGTIPES